MLERLNFLIVYIGSAAMAAFLAACLSSPQVSTFSCHPSGANGAERCELSSTQAAFVTEAGEANPEVFVPDVTAQEPAAFAAASQ